MNFNHSEQFTIRDFQVDKQNEASMASICRLLQETAWGHAEKIDLGYRLFKEGKFWALNRMYFEINRFPVYQENISIETWVKDSPGIFAFREFCVKDEKGNELINCSSKWLLLDLVRRRPCRISSIDRPMPERIDREFFALGKDVLKKDPRGVIIDNTRVGYLDLDRYGHVNNVRYLEWVLANFSGQHHSEKQLASIDIYFRKEAVEGDEIQIEQSESSNQDHQEIYLVNKEAGTLYSGSILSWKERLGG
ncbi:thioesterase [Chitinophagales bacterium]|nr:thioesterase [Chitinophagales bacterium]